MIQPAWSPTLYTSLLTAECQGQYSSLSISHVEHPWPDCDDRRLEPLVAEAALEDANWDVEDANWDAASTPLDRARFPTVRRPSGSTESTRTGRAGLRKATACAGPLPYHPSSGGRRVRGIIETAGGQDRRGSDSFAAARPIAAAPGRQEEGRGFILGEINFARSFSPPITESSNERHQAQPIFIMCPFGRLGLTITSQVATMPARRGTS